MQRPDGMGAPPDRAEPGNAIERLRTEPGAGTAALLHTITTLSSAWVITGIFSPTALFLIIQLGVYLVGQFWPTDWISLEEAAEILSASNIRFRPEGKNKTELVHTLNGSGLAMAIAQLGAPAV